MKIILLSGDSEEKIVAIIQWCPEQAVFKII